MEKELSLLPFQQPELIWSPRKPRTVPGRLHTWKVAQSQHHKDLDQPLLLLIDFFSQSTSCPQGSQPQLAVPCAEAREQHPQPMGHVVPACPANTHEPPRAEQEHSREGQSDAKPQGGARTVSAGILQLWDRYHQWLMISGSHTFGIISKSPLRSSRTPVHSPALAWAALEAFLCFK